MNGSWSETQNQRRTKVEGEREGLVRGGCKRGRINGHSKSQAER